MSPGITLVVLLAAVLHASWNALLRAGGDRLWSMTIMCIAIALVCLALVFFVPMPATASWVYAILSALLHIGYNLCLVRAYEHGDLGQTYPISRGTSPLLVTLGAAVFAHERPDAVATAGVLLVSGGILSLAFQGRGSGHGIGRGSLVYALATGCFIGAYSVTDGIGARLSDTPVGYTAWMCLLWGLLAPPVYAAQRDWRSLVRDRRATCWAAGGGIVSLVAYGIIIAAMSLGPMGSVSALRETSVVMAALIGRFFLHERLTVHRIAACMLVALGALCIGHGG